jgi:hypothetical protein
MSHGVEHLNAMQSDFMPGQELQAPRDQLNSYDDEWFPTNGLSHDELLSAQEPIQYQLHDG